MDDSDPYDGINEDDRYVIRKGDQCSKKARLSKFLPPLPGDSDDENEDDDSVEPCYVNQGPNTQALALTISGPSDYEKAMQIAIPTLSNAVGALVDKEFYHCSGKKLFVFRLADGSGLAVEVIYPHLDGVMKFSIIMSTKKDKVEYEGAVPAVIEPTLVKVKKYMDMYHAYLKLVNRAALRDLSITKLLVDNWLSLEDLRCLPGFKPIMILLFNNTKPPSECPKKEVTALRWFPVTFLQAVCTLSQMPKYAPSGASKKTPTPWNFFKIEQDHFAPSTTFGTEWDQLVLDKFINAGEDLQPFVNMVFRSTINRATLPFCDYSHNKSVFSQAQEDQRQAGAQKLLNDIDNIAATVLTHLSDIQSINKTINDNKERVEEAIPDIEFLRENKLLEEAQELKKNMDSLKSTNEMLQMRNASLADQIVALENDLNKKAKELKQKSDLSTEEKAKLVESGRKIQKIQDAVRRSRRTTAGIPAERHQ